MSGGETSGFGLRRDPLTGILRQHSGVDYDGAAGTPVYAAASGEVVFAGPQPGYGTILVIRHPALELETAYAYITLVAIKPGDCVARGQQIGVIALNGASTHPHLHFEVRRAVDPAPLLE